MKKISRGKINQYAFFNMIKISLPIGNFCRPMNRTGLKIANQELGSLLMQQSYESLSNDPTTTTYKNFYILHSTKNVSFNLYTEVNSKKAYQIPPFLQIYI